MSEASAAPAFDIGTGGACIQTDWPAADTPWLALDLDRSGSIDGGHELFGSGTVLASGQRAPHGFLALAELDSNGDGRITKADERFDELLVPMLARTACSTMACRTGTTARRRRRWCSRSTAPSR